MTLQRDFDLTRRNTFGMKVKCSCFVEYESVAELSGIDFDSLPQPFLHIGEGSNLLFTGDFPGTVFHSLIKYVKYVDMGFDEVPVMVGAGVAFDEFVSNVASNGLWGAENLSLIPGETGAAAVQNIGAYGVEVADIVSGVVCFDLQERRKVSFKASECEYGYRDSRFKNSPDKGRYIVTSVLFRLHRNYNPKIEYKGIRGALGIKEGETPADLTPMKVREAVIALRNSKLPDPAVLGSAGSFFKNPVVSAGQFAHIREVVGPECEVPHYDLPYGMVKIPAAWLIENCSLKGLECGGAAIYENQPLVIVNKSGDALPSDILSLEEKVVGTVNGRFGVRLQPEVEHIIV